MNMQNLMAQAQKMQRDITKKQEEINQEEFTGKSEWVEITLYGNKSVKNIKITKEKNIETDDFEALEDMIKIALEDSLSKIEAETKEKMGMYAQMNGLF